MRRRNFLELLPYANIGASLFPMTSWEMIEGNNFYKTKHVNLNVIDAESVDVLNGNSVAFGWQVIGIQPNKTILCKPAVRLAEANLYIRVSTAQETWDKKKLHVSIPEENIDLGYIDIRSSSVLVPYELEIDSRYVKWINKRGLQLYLEAEKPLWIFNSEPADVENHSFLPHILVSSKNNGTTQDFLKQFMSVNSIQSFGWREGTVLDGLWQLYAQKGEDEALRTINQHLNLFFDEKKNLIYETSRNIRKINELDGIESTIPFATIARIDPNHPILPKVVEAWQSYTMKNGMVTGGMSLTAEGCYTVAYPMAVIGKLWKDEKLMENALNQLRHRFVLIEEGKLHLRYNEGKTTYTNWARGAAWTLIGFARTITELKDKIKDDIIINKFREGVDIAVSMQKDSGLWSCFMHQDGLPDTSGSAGISAAIMTGINEGFLDESYQVYAEKCWNALHKYITPDGFLRGVAQDNRGGVELQQSNYRVIAQMGMGLMAQLYASL